MRRVQKASSAAAPATSKLATWPPYRVVSDTNATGQEGERRLVLQIDRTAIDEEIQRAFEPLRKRVRVHGFRQGRAPMPVLERAVGVPVRENTRQRMFASAVASALLDLGIDPIEEPAIESIGNDTGGESIRPSVLVAATFHVTPPFTPILEGITVTRPAVVVTAEKLATALRTLRENAATYPVFDGPSQIGDFVRVRWLASGQENMYELGHHAADFDPYLVGTWAGTMLKAAPMLGQLATAGAEIVEVRRQVIPPLDVDLATRTIGRASVKALADNVRARTRAYLNDQANELVDRRAMEALIAKIPFDIPRPMVNRELRRRQQVPENIDDEAPERLNAQTGVAFNLVLEAVARAHDVTVTDGDVYTHLKASIGDLPIEEALAQAGGVAAVRASLRRRAAMAIIRQRITIEQAPETELEAPDWPEDGQPVDTGCEPVTTQESPHERRNSAVQRPGDAA